jgi:4-oxalocrotonate tautomerase
MARSQQLRRRVAVPFVNIKVAGPTLAPEQVRHLQQGATRLMAEVMRKKPELTAVLVEQIGAAGWTVDGEQARAAAHLDVKVTAGTNTEAEKARFIADATRLLRDVLGSDLHPVAYVVVHEVPVDAWGWDGQTQAGRAAASVTKAA